MAPNGEYSNQYRKVIETKDIISIIFWDLDLTAGLASQGFAEFSSADLLGCNQDMPIIDVISGYFRVVIDFPDLRMWSLRVETLM